MKKGVGQLHRTKRRASGRVECELTLLEVAPKMQNLPYTESDQSGEGQEEEVANSVVGRFCER